MSKACPLALAQNQGRGQAGYLPARLKSDGKVVSVEHLSRRMADVHELMAAVILKM